jgi:hypothetical protein
MSDSEHRSLLSANSANPTSVDESAEKLYSAREAALLLGVNPRTAQLRARRALSRGDRFVRWIASAYCAPEWWWRDLLAGPIEPGRPRTR